MFALSFLNRRALPALASTLGAFASGCELPSTPSDEFVAEHAAALEEAPLQPSQMAAWRIQLELEQATTLELRVPFEVLQPKGAFDPRGRLDAPRSPLRDRMGNRTKLNVDDFAGALEVALFDANTGEKLSVGLLEDDQRPFAAEIPDPCGDQRGCTRAFVLRTRWLGVAPIIVRPDVEIAAEGRVDFAR